MRYLFLCYIKITSLSATDSSAFCLEYFWLDYKEETFSLSWATRTDSLPCDLPVFIYKLSECNIFELSAAYIYDFANFLVFINDTVQLDFQFHFIFIVIASYNPLTVPWLATTVT